MRGAGGLPWIALDLAKLDDDHGPVTEDKLGAVVADAKALAESERLQSQSLASATSA